MKTWVSYTPDGELPRIYVDKISVFEVISNREIGPYPGYSYCPCVTGQIAQGTDLPFHDPKPTIPPEVKTLVHPLFLTDRLRYQLREAVGVLPTKFARLMIRDLGVVGLGDDLTLAMWAAILGSDNEQVCRTEEILDL